MLLELAPSVPSYPVLNYLNDIFLEFLRKSISARDFSNALSRGSPCYQNKITRDLFRALFNEMKNPHMNQAQRQRLYDQIYEVNQNIEVVFNNPVAPLPSFLGIKKVFDAMKALTKHLYYRTKSLEKVNKAVGGEKPIHTYIEFKQLNSSTNSLCPSCGLELLTHFIPDVEDEEQRVASFDHLLSQADYPYLALNSKNLLPSCGRCNAEFKKAQNLLMKKDNRTRRRAIYPYAENCQIETSVSLTKTDPRAIFSIQVNVSSFCFVKSDKIETWKEVYQVPSRVEENHFLPFSDWLMALYDPSYKANDFITYIAFEKRISGASLNRAGRWWDHKFYSWLDDQPIKFKKDLWSSFESFYKKQEHDCIATFS